MQEYDFGNIDVTKNLLAQKDSISIWIFKVLMLIILTYALFDKIVDKTTLITVILNKLKDDDESNGQIRLKWILLFIFESAQLCFLAYTISSSALFLLNSLTIIDMLNNSISFVVFS